MVSGNDSNAVQKISLFVSQEDVSVRVNYIYAKHKEKMLNTFALANSVE